MNNDEMRFQVALEFLRQGRGLPQISIELADVFMKEFNESRPEFKDPKTIRAEIWKEFLCEVETRLTQVLKGGFSVEVATDVYTMNSRTVLSENGAKTIAGAVMLQMRDLNRFPQSTS